MTKEELLLDEEEDDPKTLEELDLEDETESLDDPLWPDRRDTYPEDYRRRQL